MPTTAAKMMAFQTASSSLSRAFRRFRELPGGIGPTGRYWRQSPVVSLIGALRGITTSGFAVAGRLTRRLGYTINLLMERSVRPACLPACLPCRAPLSAAMDHGPATLCLRRPQREVHPCATRADDVITRLIPL